MLSTRLLLLLLLCISIHLTMSQVTFSKGWGPGKRSIIYEGDPCRPSAKNLMFAFRALTMATKRLLLCENPGALER